MQNFIACYCSELRPALSRAVLLRYRMRLGNMRLTAATIKLGHSSSSLPPKPQTKPQTHFITRKTEPKWNAEPRRRFRSAFFKRLLGCPSKYLAVEWFGDSSYVQR